MATRSKAKALVRAENKDRRPKAIAKYIRISPSKVLKCLNSAAANAEVNNGMNKDNLYVAECFADQGPTLKRMQPVSRGRGYRILKRTSHITVILDERA